MALKRFSTPTSHTAQQSWLLRLTVLFPSTCLSCWGGFSFLFLLCTRMYAGSVFDATQSVTFFPAWEKTSPASRKGSLSLCSTRMGTVFLSYSAAHDDEHRDIASVRKEGKSFEELVNGQEKLTFLFYQQLCPRKAGPLLSRGR